MDRANLARCCGSTCRIDDPNDGCIFSLASKNACSYGVEFGLEVSVEIRSEERGELFVW